METRKVTKEDLFGAVLVGTVACITMAMTSSNIRVITAALLTQLGLVGW